MKKKSIVYLTISIILVIISAVFFMWTLKYNEIKKENVVEEELSKTRNLNNSEYTDFVFYKEDKTEVKLSDYKDKATMILFWNPSNEDSVEDLKKVNSMYENYKEKINFFMINTAKEIDEKIKEEVSMEIFYDFYDEGQIKYKVIEVPTLLYITADNEILNAKVGFTTTDALEANLDLLSNNI